MRPLIFVVLISLKMISNVLLPHNVFAHNSFHQDLNGPSLLCQILKSKCTDHYKSTVTTLVSLPTLFIDLKLRGGERTAKKRKQGHVRPQVISQQGLCSRVDVAVLFFTFLLYSESVVKIGKIESMTMRKNFAPPWLGKLPTRTAKPTCTAKLNPSIQIVH